MTDLNIAEMLDLERDEDKTLTMKQWSVRLGIPVSALRTAVRAGNVPAFQFTDNGNIYIRAASMVRFLEESAQRARSDGPEQPQD